VHTNIPAFDNSSSITATAYEIHESRVGDMVIFMIIKDILGSKESYVFKDKVKMANGSS